MDVELSEIMLILHKVFLSFGFRAFFLFEIKIWPYYSLDTKMEHLGGCLLWETNGTYVLDICLSEYLTSLGHKGDA